jgi:hypothetical protein
VKPTIGEVGADLAQFRTYFGVSRDSKEGSAHHFWRNARFGTAILAAG